jgi:hypothetical protein
MTTAQDGGKVISLTHPPRSPPGNTTGTHFCYRLSRPQGHSATGRIMSLKNSNDTIGNRTRDLPFREVVPYYKYATKRDDCISLKLLPGPLKHVAEWVTNAEWLTVKKDVTKVVTFNLLVIGYFKFIIKINVSNFTRNIISWLLERKEIESGMQLIT